MIELKHLQNRKYAGKDCIAFDYLLDPNPTGYREYKALNCHFDRGVNPEEVKDDDPAFNMWLMTVTIPRTERADSQTYYICYTMPQKDLPLELICATGLTFFKTEMQREVQYRSLMDFVIGQATAGM